LTKIFEENVLFWDCSSDIRPPDLFNTLNLFKQKRQTSYGRQCKLDKENTYPKKRE
jgi:hypothetical protein